MSLNILSVTVLLPIKHCELEYLKLAVESITEQTMCDFEFLIINENGSANVSEYLEEISDKDQRIKLLIPKGCWNLPSALNFGLGHATGQFIARMDADDIAAPDRFEKQIDFLKANSDISVLGSNVQLIDRHGNPMKIRTYPIAHRQIKFNINFRNPIAHPTAMIRTSALLEIGGYDENFDVAEDYDLWFKMMKSGHKFANLQQPLLSYRVEDAQARSNKDWINVLKIKFKNFSFGPYFFLLVLGVVQTLIALITPKIVLDHLYKVRFNNRRWIK